MRSGLSNGALQHTHRNSREDCCCCQHTEGFYKVKVCHGLRGEEGHGHHMPTQLQEFIRYSFLTVGSGGTTYNKLSYTALNITAIVCNCFACLDMSVTRVHLPPGQT